MKRVLAKKTTEKINEEVTVMGWVNSRRDHGGLIFIDMRDESGVVQLTCTPESKELFKTAESLRDEFVIKASGNVKERGKDLVNPNLETGEIEIVISELTILNKSEALPFQIGSDSNVGEETRLKYRFLDLRRQKMQHMLKKRNDFNQNIHKYMQGLDFTEIVTPILANSSPEGARDYLVPSRLHPGKFYALPQAPQQFKQLLMVGGIPRYYQIAPCFRDEDPRADRHPGEFYQLDLEMAFVEDGQEVRDTIQPLIVDLSTKFAGKELAHDILTLTFDDAMNRFGSDRPDLRFEMELVDLSEDLKNTEFSVFSGAIKDGGAVKAICVKDGSKLSRSQIDKFTEVAKQAGAGGLAYITVENGEAKSPIAKFFNETELKAIFDKTDAKDGDTIFFGSDKLDTVNNVLGKLRIAFADHFELRDENKISLLWIVDFPYYELNEYTGKPDFSHNPFSMPKAGIKGLDAPDSELLKIVADQYDMVANGYEICSGGIRNHNPEIMYKAFGNLGFDKDYVNKKFGAMINAFKFGAPPHGGCAFGLDRLFMVLMNEPNIREVIAFPKNGSAIDAMTNSPSIVDEEQLKELSIKVIESED